MAESRDEATLTGRRLGRYELGERIGAGPRTWVHHARIFGVEGFVKDVALKIPRVDIVADADALEAFVQGARRAVGLSHASLLQLVDVGRATLDDGDREVTYVVTELARGIPLEVAKRAIEAAGARISLGVVLSLGADVARALDYIHRRVDDDGALMHGSLHARQIFVSSEGQIKVGDACLFHRRHKSSGPTDDLRGLGLVLRSLIPFSRSEPSAAVLELVAALEQRRIGEAAEAHERLLDLAFTVSPSPEDRHTGRLARIVESPNESPTVQVALDLEVATPVESEVAESAPTDLPSETKPGRVVARAQWRFVGRGPELRALGAAIERTLSEGAVRLTVRGRPGIGKSRLVRELARRVPKEKVGFAFVDGARATRPSIGRIGSIVRAVLGLPDDRAIAREDIVLILRSVGLESSDVASLCRALGVAVEIDRRPSLLADALARLLAVVRMGRPLVLILDDADAIDRPSLDVIASLVGSAAARALPVLVLLVQTLAPATRRATRVDGLEVGKDDLVVDDLDEDAVAQILATRLGARLIPPELFELSIECAGGHPYLLEELVHELVDLALVRVRGGVAELVGSPSEQSAIAARLAGDYFTRTGDPARAGRSFCAAARAYEALGEKETAVELLALALADLEDPELASEALEGIVRLAELADLRGSDIAEGVGHCLALADEVRAPEERATIRLRAARAFALQGQDDIASILCDQAAELIAAESTARDS